MSDDAFEGFDVSGILNSTGPVIKCVLVRSDQNEEEISEVSIDTTPKKREVESLMGGPVTFLGQYEEEGVIAMTKKKEEKNENRIVLPPPLDEVEVSNSVLLMKVAHENENTDQFFLDYKKESWLDLIRRGGEKKNHVEENEEEEEECCSDDADSDVRVFGDEESDEEDEEFMLEDCEDCDDMELDGDGERIGMLNLCMGQILRQFYEENGRGPDTRQLLEMRHALAERLGVEVPPLDCTDNDSETVDSTSLKRPPLEDNDDSDEAKRKKVKFSSCLEEEHEIFCHPDEHEIDNEEHFSLDENQVAT